MANLICFAKKKNAVLLNPGFDRFGYARYFDFTDRNPLCAYPHDESSTAGPGLGRKAAFAFHKFLCGYPIVRRYFFTGGKLYRRAGLLPASFARYLLLGTADNCDLDDDNDPLVCESKNSKYIFIGGWMLRARQGFDRNAEEIRRIFTPKARYMSRVNELIGKAREGADTLVGVHIRHGDYKEHFGGIYYFETGVYIEKMKQVQTLFEGKKVRFLVCSNTGLSETDFPGLEVTCGTGEQIEDMYALAACDYLIGPPSTFTAWASFYGKKPLALIKDTGEKITFDKFRIFNSQEFLDLDNLFF